MLKAEERPAVKTVNKAEVRPAGKTSTMYIKTINFWRRKTSHWPNWPLVDFSAKESLPRSQIDCSFNVFNLIEIKLDLKGG